MIITIDGPAGSGKSTAARKLAARLGVPYLDTGAMYRAIAYTGASRGVDLTQAEAVVSVVRAANLELDCGPTYTRVRVDGRDVSESLRSIENSAATSHVARHQAVRDLLVEQQRALGASLGSCVSEGRDQGSVVFPDADAKFVLEASLRRRAERRMSELQADGEEVTIDEVAGNLDGRDQVDAKQWAPLLRSGQAIIIDTTDMTISQVVDRLVAELVQRGLPVGASRSSSIV